MSKETGKAARPSFSLRLQPYQGSLLAEVVQYLNALDRSDAMRQVENVLVMALLAQARLYDEACSQEERRRCCIEACDALDKHASMLRQLVGVERPMQPVVPSYQAMPVMQRVAAPDGHGWELDGNASEDDRYDEEDNDDAAVRSP